MTQVDSLRVFQVFRVFRCKQKKAITSQGNGPRIKPKLVPNEPIRVIRAIRGPRIKPKLVPNEPIRVIRAIRGH